MWSRSELKQRAKAVLKQSYWSAFVVALVLTLIIGGGTSTAGASAGSAVENDINQGTNVVQLPFGEGYPLPGFEESAGELAGVMAVIVPILFVVFTIAGILFFLLRLLLLAPLEVGCRRYFLESTQYRFQMGEMAFAFSCGGYRRIVGTMFLRDLYTTLWTLLLVIPGIVKSYAYRMTPYILAENPTMPTGKAITLSREMTRGHRWNMFVLDLSFFGWLFLGTLACGIGTLFVTPYVYTTDAELYLVLREQALQRGAVTLEDLSPNRF